MKKYSHFKHSINIKPFSLVGFEVFVLGPGIPRRPDIVIV